MTHFLRMEKLHTTKHLTLYISLVVKSLLSLSYVHPKFQLSDVTVKFFLHSFVVL